MGSTVARPQERAMEEDGYVVREGVIPAALCTELKDYVDANIERWRGASRLDLFGNIQEADLRHDLKLPMTGCVRRVLNCVVEKCRDVLVPLVGDNAALVELAAIASDPGALSQAVHADTAHAL